MAGYTLVYWQDGEWLVGRLRERPDVFSQGKSLAELAGRPVRLRFIMKDADLYSIQFRD